MSSGNLSEKGKILDSWKEIAAYLNRNVRTCQVWEHEHGLPIHRLEGSSRGRVFTYTSELDAWREAKGRLPAPAQTPNGGGEAGRRSLLSGTAARIWPIRARVLIALTAAVALAALAGLIFFLRSPRIERPAVGRFTLKIQPGYWLAGLRRAEDLQRPSRKAIAISRDGRFVIYSAIEEDPGPEAQPRLYLRRMDQEEARPIAGTEGGINPFLSPDSRWVGFWAEGKLKKVLVEGGVPITLCRAPSLLYGAHWAGNNSIVFSDGEASGLCRVPAEGGRAERLTLPDPDKDEYSHRLPFWLPNGKAILFTGLRHGWDPEPWLGLFRLETGERRLLLADAANPRYVASGHIVFLRRGVLMAVRFDPNRLEVRGQPFPLVENVMQAFSADSEYNTAAGQYGISDNGTLVYAPGGVTPSPRNSLVWVDDRGLERLVTGLGFPFVNPRLSPDGRRIAFDTGIEGRVWVYDLGLDTNSPLTEEGRALFPLWTADGRRIIFAWQKSKVMNIFWQAADGSSPMERLTTSPWNQSPGAISPDGRVLAVVERSPAGTDIALLDLASRRLSSFLCSPYGESDPEFSPDGRWLAYTSDESGRDEVYVRAFPGPGIKEQVSSQGGLEPLWSRDGRRLFFRRQGQVWMAEVGTAGGFRADKPRLLLERTGGRGASPVRTYDLSPDGRRFLMVKFEARPPAPITEMILVENWFEEIRRLDASSRN